MRFRRLLPHLFSLCAGLLLGEIALRVAGARFATSFYVVDPDLGWALRPESSGTYTEEAVVPIKINAAGMRDDVEHPLAKAPGVYRVAILGDSFTEAFQVPLEQTFSKKLEGDLKACHTNPEVLNFGVQGYGTAQELLVWRMKAAAYKPDAVILLFYTGNDLYNNHRKLNPTNADAAPYFVIENGSLVLQPALAKPGAMREVWASIVRYSRLAQFGTDVFYKMTRPVSTTTDHAYIDRLTYSPPADSAMREAWSVTEALLPKFRDEVTASGAKFVLALASTSMQVHPDPALRAEFLKSTGGTDLFYTENRLAAKMPGTLELGRQMQREAERTGTMYHGFPGNLGHGHWNADGHKYVSAALGSSLCK